MDAPPPGFFGGGWGWAPKTPNAKAGQFRPNPNPNQALAGTLGFFPSFLPSGGRAPFSCRGLGVASCAFVAAPCVDIKHSRVGVTRRGHCSPTVSTVSWRHLEAPTNPDSPSKSSCSARRITCFCSKTCSCSMEGPKLGFLRPPAERRRFLEPPRVRRLISTNNVSI